MGAPLAPAPGKRISPFASTVLSALLSPLTSGLSGALLAPFIAHTSMVRAATTSIGATKLAAAQVAMPQLAVPMLADTTQCIGLYQTWTYSLVVEQQNPSRMAVVKNVLGSSVPIITAWEPPASWPQLPSAWTLGTVTTSQSHTPLAVDLAASIDLSSAPTNQDVTFTVYDKDELGQDIVGANSFWAVGDAVQINSAYDGWPYQGSITTITTNTITVHFVGTTIPQGYETTPFPVGWPISKIPVTVHKYNWTVTYSGYMPDPGIPFTAFDSTTGTPTLGTPAVHLLPGAHPEGTCTIGDTLHPCNGVIRSFADAVNFGLETFPGTPASNNLQRLRVMIDTGDSGDAGPIEDAMQLASAGGLNAAGDTPTLSALEFAKTVMYGATSGEMFSDCTTQTFNDPSPGSDTKFFCGRKNAVLLVTDGTSNAFNPVVEGCNTNSTGGNWIQPGLPCDCATRGTGCPDGGSSGYTCPDHPELFEAGKADDLYTTLSYLTNPLQVRTWVVGLSQDVAPCELNNTAYHGRTDARTVGTPAFKDPTIDPNLPPSDFQQSNSYAFFANNSQQLRDAISAILASSGSGDYATGSPSASGVSSGNGLVAYASSAVYPSWKGHFYAYDLSKDCSNPALCSGPCGGSDSNCLWDAGAVLSGGNNGMPRSIWTWDASTTPYTPVKIDPANTATLNTLCGSCGFTSEVVDFTLGNDGSGSPRSWKLGAIINSTPAVIGPPQVWDLSTQPHHVDFERDYGRRHELVWVGSSDGMMHAFDTVDGAEIVAIIPPELLRNQVALHDNYVAGAAGGGTPPPVGEPAVPGDHIYGVANSPRFADIGFGQDNAITYKTVLFLTDGPGGTGLHAIDVTHPYYADRVINGTTYQKDPGYDPLNPQPPIAPLWSLTRDGLPGASGTQLSTLGNTWSIPALGLAAANPNDEWDLFVGSGWDKDVGDSSGNNVSNSFYRIDPTNGTVLNTYTVSGVDASSAFVRSQTFSDTVVWGTRLPYFKPDNVVDESLQVDLNGRVWVTSNSGGTWSTTAARTLTNNEPIYYPPAVAAAPATRGLTPTWDAYAYATGSFYETSPNVSGRLIGTSPNFVPSLYINVHSPSGAHQLDNGTSIALDTIARPGGTGPFEFLSRHTQVNAPPLLLSQENALAYYKALFLVYDPDYYLDPTRCVGTSYVIEVDFNPQDLTALTVSVGQAGSGVAGGFGIIGEHVYTTQSFVGEEGTGRANIQVVPGIMIPSTSGLSGVRWWTELQ